MSGALALICSVVATAALEACAASASAAAAAPTPVSIERRLGVMATDLALVVEAGDRATALAASEAAVRALERAEGRLTTWRAGSELQAFNATPVGVAAPLSLALAGDLRAARRCSQRTDGAFDPGIGALVAAWGLRSGGRLPSRSERRAAIRAGGNAAWRLQAGSGTRLHPGLRIEEGGFGKGAGLDDAMAAMAAMAATAPTAAEAMTAAPATALQAGVLAARLDLGGQVAIFGKPARVTVSHPDRRTEPVLELELEAGSLSTSGNSERSFSASGRRFGHLLDPRTGQPARDFGSVSVWARSALEADCLSTGLFVMGPARALRWARAHPEVEVLVLQRRGAGVLANATKGLRDRVRPLIGAMEVRFQ